MTRLSSFLSADDVRQIHWEIFTDEGQEYLRRGPHGLESRDDIRQRIRNVKGNRVRQTIDPVEEFTARAFRKAWAHYMALVAGTHVWPDANHRTGMVSFSLATSRAFGFNVSLPVDAAVDMVRQSKHLRDAELMFRGRYYQVRELAASEHPYRQLFLRFAPQLETM